jgi:hypothetical protein
VNNHILPGVYIENGLQEFNYTLDSFSTLFISSEIDTQQYHKYGLMYFESFSQVIDHELLTEEMFLTKAMDIYFANGGKSLYILAQPKKEILSDKQKYKAFLEKNIDALLNIETIVLIDLLMLNETFEFNHEQIQNIQNSVSEYCNDTNRLSIMDLSLSDPIEHASTLHYTIVFYPWIKSRYKGMLYPPSIYASAILSKLAHEKKFFHSIANIKLEHIVDTEPFLEKHLASQLYEQNINPIIYLTNDGYKIWGIRTLGCKIPDITTLRVYFYIKRILQSIAKEYLFEPNDDALKKRLSRKVENFLFGLWKNGALKGSSQNEAYILTVHKETEVLTLDIAVSISKPLEYIYIQLNRTTGGHLNPKLTIS